MRKPRCFWIFSGFLALLSTPVWIGIIFMSRSFIISEKGWQAEYTGHLSGEIISYREAKKSFWRSNISNYAWRFFTHKKDDCPHCTGVRDTVTTKKCEMFRWHDEAPVPSWTPYLLFAFSGTWIWFSTTFLPYARSCELQEEGHQTPKTMVGFCFVSGMCFQVMAILPQNNCMFDGYLPLVGYSHLAFATLGFIFALVHHGIHLRSTWKLIGIVVKIFFIVCLLVVPPCLVMWRVGFWKAVPNDCMLKETRLKIINSFKNDKNDHGENSLKLRFKSPSTLGLDCTDGLEAWRPYSLFEWIAATTLFLYFSPYALWFFKKAMAMKEERSSEIEPDFTLLV